MNVVFPMAGQGARFGYRFKPFLTVDGEPFIAAAVAPFRKHLNHITRFTFVYLATQEGEFDVKQRLGQMFADLPCDFVTLGNPTRGPAETVGGAVEKRGMTGPGFICDCDHAVDVSPLFELVAKGDRFDALLPVWPLQGENLASWSVARVDGGRVCAIAEKKMPPGERGQAMGVIGCYGFADLSRAAATARSLGATNFSDVLRDMIERDAIVRAEPITNARFFGDPERLAQAETSGSAS